MDLNGNLNQAMFDLSRSVFLESLKTMNLFQEKMVDMSLSMMPWLSDESRQAAKDFLDVHKRGQERFQNQIFQGYAGIGPMSPFTLFSEKREAVSSQDILADIEAKVLDRLNFGFTPDVLHVLNDPNAMRRDIEALKGKISPELLAKVMDISDSAYFGTLKKGRVKSFYDAVMVLGMKHAEVIILYFSVFILAKDKQTELTLAKSFARYVIGGYVFAKEFGLNEEETYKLELGCLFMDIGKLVFLLYKAKYPEEYQRSNIDEAFIEKHHSYLGAKVCDKFNVTEEIRKIIFHSHFDLDSKHVSLSGILRTIYCLIESLFQSDGGKLIITSPMPDDRGWLTHSVGVVIRDLFTAVGLSEYLEIIVPPGEDDLSQATSGRPTQPAI
jgi:HD-like signal output (HDOD) protein